MWWRCTTATILGVSFGTYRRRGTDVLMGRRENVPLRRLGDVPLSWDIVECFIWALFERSRRRTDKTLLLGPLETSSRRSNKTSWRRTTETSWLGDVPSRHRWVFHLRLTCDIAGTYRWTWLRRRHDTLLSGGLVMFMYSTISMGNAILEKREKTMFFCYTLLFSHMQVHFLKMVSPKTYSCL